MVFWLSSIASGLLAALLLLGCQTPDTGTVGGRCNRKVFVMLELDTVNNVGQLKDPNALKGHLQHLKSGNVDGIMVDVWWGLTEPFAETYHFGPYMMIVNMCREIGLKVQFVTSFHQCGGNVGDTCNIPLPAFVNIHRDIWYKDQHGNEDKEYISLFADNVNILGRTPMQMYGDWFQALAKTFHTELGSTIVEIQVGMGPSGELRYPSYQLSRWHFCGVGAFQAYDSNALQSLRQAAHAAGHGENWSKPPDTAGDYNSKPQDVDFFQTDYQTEKGRFFLEWYSQALLRHGQDVLSGAKQAFGKYKVLLAGKVSGIHWWYNSSHHAAELTAGYYNANGNDAYLSIAKMFASTADAGIDFTCLEMADAEQPSSCACGPEELVQQVARASHASGVLLDGENALPRYDDAAFGKIVSYKGLLSSFTYLRLSGDLLKDENWNRFRNFVNRMHNNTESQEVKVSL